MLWLLLREFLIQFAGQLMDVGGLAKSLNLKGRGFNVDARVLAELLQHLEHHGELLFGEHTDLKIKMRAPLAWRAMRFWLISTKMVRNTLSEETKRARMPNGKGSKAFTLGIKLRFTVLQTTTKITWNIRNFMLPMNFTMASLLRSVTVRRSKASSSNLAMASILNCVGLLEIWSDSAFFMHGTPAHAGSHSHARLASD